MASAISGRLTWIILSYCMQPTVLITRPTVAALETAKAWQLAGFKTAITPLLEVDFMPITLPPIRNYQAIITTSAMAVRALARLTPCRTLALWCVGDASKTVAKDLGFQAVFSPPGQKESAVSLANTLSQEINPNKGPLLYCRGAIINVNLAAVLACHNLQMDEVVVYQTLPNHKTWPTLERLLKDIETGGISFYSARTAHIFSQFANQSQFVQGRSGCYPLALSSAIACKVQPFFTSLPIIRSTTLALIATLKEQLSYAQGR